MTNAVAQIVLLVGTESCRLHQTPVDGTLLAKPVTQPCRTRWPFWPSK